ncbi:hypothetical protein MYX76_05850 [Desulfobacterota bacterium AH_259_B03_O07]|nr:hypothetical protein [Desulfobacterota bacterium AH_259_B03_O07]
MKITKYLFFIIVALLINLQALNAASLLGKVAVYTSPSNPEIFPLVSGNRMSYGHRALIRISGGTFIAEKGTVLEAIDEGEKVIFQIEKGILNFRFQPHKTIVSFNTKDGVISPPKIVKANSSIVEGRIVVSENSTVLDLSEGTLAALSSKGLTEISAGKKIILAQATIDLEEFVGKKGTNSEECTPDCNGVIEGNNNPLVVVDDNGKPIEALSDNPLPGETELVVKNVLLRDGVFVLGVQPTDKELLAAILLTAAEVGPSAPSVAAVVVPSLFTLPFIAAAATAIAKDKAGSPVIPIE